MRGVYAHVVVNQAFREQADEIDAIGVRDFVNACLAAGECHSIREALRKKGIDTKVKTLLRNMKLAMRNVERSEGERKMLWMKFTAMCVWNGCSLVFFTLNPHDIWNPLLVVFAGAEGWDTRKFSLDWSDEEMNEF